MKPTRDRLFWFVVAGLALGTALITTHSFSPRALGQSLDGVRRSASSVATAAKTTAPRPSAGNGSRPTTARQASPPDPPAPRSAATAAGRAERLDRETVRRALADHLRAARQRRHAEPNPAPTGQLDPSSGMPLMEMDWAQYRVWVKYGDALAERDYRAVERALGETREAFDEPTQQILIDGLVDDYQRYLEAVIETECSGYDPQSVWRKTLFVSLLLAKLERLGPELSAKEEQARLACDF